MISDTHLDGNALGGLFHELFGQEMTHRRGCCDNCGTVSPLGSVMVYRSAGDVLRCPACGSVIMVIVSSPDGHRIHFQSLRWVVVPEAEAGSVGNVPGI